MAKVKLGSTALRLEIEQLYADAVESGANPDVFVDELFTILSISDKKAEQIPDLEAFLDYVKHDLSKFVVYDAKLEFALRAKYEKWRENGWAVGKAKKPRPIKNWKLQIKNTLPYMDAVFLSNKRIKFQDVWEKVYQELLKTKPTEDIRGSMPILVEKIRSKYKENQAGEPTDEEMGVSLEVFMKFAFKFDSRNGEPGFMAQNYSLRLINSQFDKIYAAARRKEEQRTSGNHSGSNIDEAIKERLRGAG